MKLPWWLNPWRERQRLLDAVSQWAADFRSSEACSDALASTVKTHEATIIALRERNHELQRQLKIAGSATPGTGRALVGYEQGGGAKPEFVICGVDRGAAGGKRIYASRDIGAPSFGAASEDDPSMRLQATMGRQLIIDKPGYAECLDRMAQIWRNWDNPADGTLAASHRRREIGP